MQPIEIDVDRNRELRIRWSDGVTGVIALPELRRQCPCATCRAARDELSRDSNPLRVLRSAARIEDMAAVASVELVGCYALRVRWMDGHDTGIYGFHLLRELGVPGAVREPGTGA